MLRFLLQQAGCQQLHYQAHAVDYSYGTEAHESNVQNMLVFHKLYQAFLIQMEKDMQAEDFCAIDFFLTVWGRKGE
jgi:hypothetical protein